MAGVCGRVIWVEELIADVMLIPLRSSSLSGYYRHLILNIQGIWHEIHSIKTSEIGSQSLVGLCMLESCDV